MLKLKGIAVLLMFTLAFIACSSLIACSTTQPTQPPSTEESSEEPSIPPEPEPLPKPLLKATGVVSDDTLVFGQIFGLTIAVNNYGSGPALNTQLYVRANPAGYFDIIRCTPDPSPLAPAGIKVSLGDIYPDGRSDVQLRLRAPTQAQVGGAVGMNYEIDFTIDYYYDGAQQPEESIGTLSWSVSQSGRGPIFYR